jgi:hypothetical protein
MSVHRLEVLSEVISECNRQDAKWGEQDHPDGTGGAWNEQRAYHLREECEEAFTLGRGTWAHIFAEEAAEALAETSQDRLYEELVQVAAVATQWAEAIKRRQTRRVLPGSVDQDKGGS